VICDDADFQCTFLFFMPLLVVGKRSYFQKGYYGDSSPRPRSTYCGSSSTTVVVVVVVVVSMVVVQ
jgi:hypothetical protein